MTSFEAQTAEQRELVDQQKRRFDQVDDKLEDMETIMEKERKLTATLSALRDSKSSVEEQLHQKKVEILAVGSRCSELERQNQRKSGDVHVLSEQLAALRAHPEPDPTLPDRLRQSERKQREVEAEVSRLHELLDKRHSEIEVHKTVSTRLQQQLEDSKMQLEKATSSLASVENEKRKLQEAANAKLEGLRAEMEGIAEAQTSALRQKHASELHDITLSKDDMQLKVADLEEEMQRHKDHSARSATRATELTSQLRYAQGECDSLKKVQSGTKGKLQQIDSELQVSKDASEANAARCLDLASHLKAAESSTADMRKQIESLSASLSKSQEDAKKAPSLEKLLEAANSDKAAMRRKIAVLNEALSKLQCDPTRPVNNCDTRVQTREENLESQIGDVARTPEGVSPPNARVSSHQADPFEPPGSAVNACLASGYRTSDSLAVDESMRREASPEIPYEGRPWLYEEQLHGATEAREPRVDEDVDLVASSNPDPVASSHSRTDQTGSEPPEQPASSRGCEPEDSHGRFIDRQSVWTIPASRDDSPQRRSNARSVRFKDRAEHAEGTESHNKLSPPTPSSDHCGRDPEVKSNSSARRDPIKAGETSATPAETDVLRETQLGGNLNLANTLGSSNSVTGLGKNDINKKRKRSSDRPNEAETSARVKQNKFNRTTEGFSQTPGGGSLGHAGLNSNDASRRAKSRISQGEVRGLGPIIGGPHSPTKSVTGSQGNGRRKKSLRKGSGLSGSIGQRGTRWLTLRQINGRKSLTRRFSRKGGSGRRVTIATGMFREGSM